MGKKEVDARFSKFGTVTFTAATKINDFIDNLEQGKITATRCKKCGLQFFPPRADCYSCFSSDMEWFEVTDSGILVSYSKLQYGPVGFEDDLPYTIAVVDYGDYKIFGRIDKDLPTEDIKIGMKMKTAANKMASGQLNYVFQKA